MSLFLDDEWLAIFCMFHSSICAVLDVSALHLLLSICEQLNDVCDLLAECFRLKTVQNLLFSVR